MSRAARRACTDPFGVKGRQWPAGLELALEERESVDAGMPHAEFLDAEIAAAERLIAQQALGWPEIRRLMAVPGASTATGMWATNQAIREAERGAATARPRAQVGRRRGRSAAQGVRTNTSAASFVSPGTTVDEYDA